LEFEVLILEPAVICRRCGSSDVMRTPRKKWEQALPLAAFCCRKCGKRFRAQRPPDEPGSREEWLVRPVRRVRQGHIELDRAVGSLFLRVTRSAVSESGDVAGLDQRIDNLLNASGKPGPFSRA
jgi:hypothetical protein